MAAKKLKVKLKPKLKVTLKKPGKPRVGAMNPNQVAMKKTFSTKRRA